MKTIFILITIILVNTNTYTQNLKWMSMDITTNTLFGGLGCCIKNGFTFLNFTSGCKKGALSGTAIYISKELLRQNVNKNYQNLNWKIFWSSKIINSIGNTLLKNAILNEKLMKNYSIEYGFLRFNLNKQNPLQILPSSLILTTYFSFSAKLDFKKSLYTGTFIFNNYNNSTTLGYTLANIIILNKNGYGNDIITHEITHIYQRQKEISLNYCFNFYTKYENYKFIHNDISLHDITSPLTKTILTYKNSPYEIEANYFGKTNLRIKYHDIPSVK